MKKLANKGDVRIVFRDGAYVRWQLRPDGDCQHDPRKALASLKQFIQAVEVGLDAEDKYSTGAPEGRRS